MPKILYLVTQSDFGGAQKYVYDLATNISKNNTVMVASGEQCKQGELAQKIKAKNITYYPISHLKRAINPWHDFFAFWQIVKLIKQEKPDIIHLNSSKISILGSLAVTWRKLSTFNFQLLTIYTVHGWVFNEELANWKKLLYKTLEKFTAKFKDKIICLSDFEKNNTIKNKITCEEKISVIYNGIKPINFLSREEARTKLNLDKNELIIGVIANLYKTKGLEYLIDATKKLMILDLPAGRQGCKFHIIIIGDGPENSNLKSKIKNLKLDDKIKLTGNITNASQYLRALDIYVCSSMKEGMPYTILEAMQAGLPIVSTNVGAIPEILENNKTGLLIESKNSKAIAEKIKYLIDNPDMTKKFGENAKEKVKEFSLEKMVKETEELYKQ